MKIYLSKINESWVVDRMRSEWYEYNGSISSKLIWNSDIIWIISPWLWKKENKYLLNKKIVVCSIYHFEEKDYLDPYISDFKERDFYVDYYHVISKKTFEQLSQITNKPIFYAPIWMNNNNFFQIEDKENLRKKYKISDNSFLIGSFQRDTEGNDLKSPKMIKGPDQFLKIVEYYNSKKQNLVIVLTGKRRQYVINGLNKLDIKFIYFEMAKVEELNELYNILDLYVVSSRIEGGPQAIPECGVTKTPIISTDVGIANEILSSKSVFNMSNFKSAEPDTEFAYKNALKLCIPQGFDSYIKFFKSIKS